MKKIQQENISSNQGRLLHFVAYASIAMLLVADLLGRNGHFDVLGLWAPGEYPDDIHVTILLLSFLIFAGILALSLKRVREALKRRLERSLRLMEQTGELSLTGGWELDLTSKTLYWCKSTFLIHGLSPQDGEPSLEQAIQFYPEPDRSRLKIALEACRTKGEPYDLELDFIDNTGAKKRVRTLGRAEEVNGKTVRLFGACQDITRVKELEEERLALLEQVEMTERLEALGQFSGGFAHEFNNILQDILLHAEEASRHCETDGVQQAIKAIKKRCANASGLCDQILVYAGTRELTNQRISPADKLSKWSPELQESLPPGCRLHLELKETEDQIWADPAQIRQMVYSLVQNAAEAYPSGRGDIFLRARTVDLDTKDFKNFISIPPSGDGSYLEIEICDHGEGLPPDIQTKIFEPFFSTKFHGRGLGLSTVLGIVRSLKGGLQVISSKADGTSFKLFFPVLGKEPSAEPKPAQQFRRPGGNTILVIDDEAGIRKGLAQALETKNYKVLTAENGRDGLEQFKNNGEDILCILLDLTMPVMDGGETLKAIREVDPAVPVIITSGYDAGDASFDIAADDFSAFLHKPFPVQVLFQAIDEATGRLPPA